MLDIKQLSVNSTWTLFLDRDGVINKKLPNNYVKNPSEFIFEEGVIHAIQRLSNLFGRIIVVTNQQGIGKGVMTAEMLEQVHTYLKFEVNRGGGKIDQIYYCPNLEEDNSICRKPNTGMAEQARRDFPEIDFKKSIMVGDSLSDMQMGKRVGMITVFIHQNTNLKMKEADLVCNSLYDFSNLLVPPKAAAFKK